MMPPRKPARKHAIKCIVSGCGNVRGGKISFFRLPRDRKRLEIWLKNCDRMDLVKYCNQYRYVCADHFDGESFSGLFGPDTRNKLKKTAVPTIVHVEKLYFAPFEPCPSNLLDPLEIKMEVEDEELSQGYQIEDVKPVLPKPQEIKDSPVLLVVGLTCLSRAREVANMSTPKVLVSNPTTPLKGIELLREKGLDVIVSDSDFKENLIKNVKGVDAIFWSSHTKLDADIIDAAGDQLKVVATMSAGYNHIDTAELKKRGIKLGNTPSVLNDAVADVAILLALGASRRIYEGRLAIENDQWQTNNSQWLLGQDIAGSTVGIVGLGGIGQAIVRRMKGFQVKEFLYNGHREKPEGKELGAKFVNLDTLTKESDFVIVAVPLTNETAEMCNDDFFKKMKTTAVFINVSRGGVVDQPALIRALKNNTIFAAGLDVMTPEPLPSDHELLKIPNLVLIPHLGSATRNTRDAMSELAAQNILRSLGGEEMFTPVKI